MSKTSRTEVFAALSNERDYQAAKWGEQAHELDAFVTYIKGYADELVRVASHTDNKTQVLDFVRKVGTLAVAAMEQHGAPIRTDAEMAAAREFGERRSTYIVPTTIATTAGEPVSL